MAFQAKGYIIITEHGYIVDTVVEKRLALSIANRTNKFPLCGNTPLHVYYCNAKGEKVFIK